MQILAGRYARAFEQNRDLGFETAFNNPAAQPAKEISMDITDLLIHVHPALSAEQRAKIEEAFAREQGGGLGTLQPRASPCADRGVRSGGVPRGATSPDRARVGSSGHHGGFVVSSTTMNLTF